MPTLARRPDMNDLTAARVQETKARSLLLTVAVLTLFAASPALVMLIWRAAL